MDLNFLSVLIAVPGIIIGLAFHEFAHGYAAHLLGDDTARYQGRLTLNPLAHLDPAGTIMIIFTMFSGFGFGWAKPVPVNPTNFTRKVTMRTGMMLTALAGPLINFLIALVAYILLYLLANGFGIQDELLLSMIYWIAKINLGLGVFNLLPVPPLDGSKVLAGILPGRFDELLDKLEQYGTIILIMLLFTGVHRIFMYPIASFLENSFKLIGLTISSLFI